MHELMVLVLVLLSASRHVPMAFIIHSLSYVRRLSDAMRAVSSSVNSRRP